MKHRYVLQWNRYELGSWEYDVSTGREFSTPSKNIEAWWDYDSYFFMRSAKKKISRLIEKTPPYSRHYPKEYRIFDTEHMKVVYHVIRKV